MRLLEAIRKTRHQGPLLPGLLQRDVRRRPAAAERNDPLPAPQPLRRRQGLRLLASTINYREAYNLFACNGILFNHESPRRGETFVTRKITRAAARIKPACRTSSTSATSTPSATGATPAITSQAMWLMLQHDQPDDFVIATGEIALGARIPRRGLRLRRTWTGRSTWRSTRATSAPPRWMYLLGDASKATQGARLGAEGHASRTWCASWSTPTWRRRAWTATSSAGRSLAAKNRDRDAMNRKTGTFTSSRSLRTELRAFKSVPVDLRKNS